MSAEKNQTQQLTGGQSTSHVAYLESDVTLNKEGLSVSLGFPYRPIRGVLKLQEGVLTFRGKDGKELFSKPLADMSVKHKSYSYYGYPGLSIEFNNERYVIGFGKSFFPLLINVYGGGEIRRQWADAITDQLPPGTRFNTRIIKKNHLLVYVLLTLALLGILTLMSIFLRR
jgi:hypothetical protein